MKKIRRAGSVITAAAVLLLAAALGCGVTVSAKAKMERAELAEYCREQEKQLVREVRAYLSDQGYRDSGVMLTRICFEDGSVQYKLTVHHRKIDKMDERGRAELKEELGDFTFPLDRCEFTLEFLIIE